MEPGPAIRPGFFIATCCKNLLRRGVKAFHPPRLFATGEIVK